MNENNGGADTENKQEDTDLDTENENEGEETIETVKAKLAEEEARRIKAEEIAENQRIRAEKAEKKAKETGGNSGDGKSEKKQSSKADDISSKDLYVLMDAKVPQEDIEDVLEYSKLKNISIADALKSNVIKTILSDKAEARRVAEATNTGITRHGTSKPSDDVLLSKASQGELPDDEAEIRRLNNLRWGKKS